MEQVCDESRSLECPPFFVSSAVRLPKYMHKARASGTGQNPSSPSTTVPIKLPQRAQQTGQASSGSANVPTNLSRVPQPRAPAATGNATSLTPLIASKWVLLVVEASGGLKLTQLRMQGLDSVSFFVHLRSEFFRLRGCFLRYFSVWGFSHCDFYRVRNINSE
jgi:hypothetical protein